MRRKRLPFIRDKSRRGRISVAWAVYYLGAYGAIFAASFVAQHNYPAIMKKLIAFLAFASLADVAAAADIVGNAKAAEYKVSMCIGCHGIPGYKATFPEVYQVPMLGGQSAQYIESALKAYKKGDRKMPTMHGIAASLSDQDMADIAAYYSQQK